MGILCASRVANGEAVFSVASSHGCATLEFPEKLSAVEDRNHPAAGDEDESDLAMRLVAREPEALALVYDRYGGLCYRLALRVTRNPALAEEAVQEAFLALWRSESFRPELGSLRSWLVGMVHHKAVDLVRREASLVRRQHAFSVSDRASVGSADGSAPGVEAEVMGRFRDGAVRAALAELEDPQKTALLLAYFEGYSQREIAAVTGVPLGTVKTRTFAALRRLRRRLAPALDEDDLR